MKTGTGINMSIEAEEREIHREPRGQSATHHRRIPPAGKAFTLVELLVVIAIIALLVAMLMPMLMWARVTAMNAQGMLDQSSIAKALHMYAGDNRGYMPIEPAVHTQQTALRFFNDASEANAQAPGGPGRYYGYSGLSGHTYFDSSWVGLAPAPYSTPNNPRYFRGAARVIPLGYLGSAIHFFHPVMRVQTQTDSSSGGLGAARHWWYFNNARTDQKAVGDPTHEFSPFGNAQYPPGHLPGTDTAGLWNNGTVGYRGGFWAPWVGTSNGTFLNDPSYVKIANCRVDTISFNGRALLASVPYENQFVRQGGRLDYTRGDGSVAITINPAFKSVTGGFWSNVGSPAPALVRMYLRSDDYFFPTKYPVISASGSGEEMITEWTEGWQDAFDMDLIDRDNGYVP